MDDGFVMCLFDGEGAERNVPRVGIHRRRRGVCGRWLRALIGFRGTATTAFEASAAAAAAADGRHDDSLIVWVSSLFLSGDRRNVRVTGNKSRRFRIRTGIRNMKRNGRGCGCGIFCLGRTDDIRRNRRGCGIRRPGHGGEGGGGQRRAQTIEGR